VRLTLVLLIVGISCAACSRGPGPDVPEVAGPESKPIVPAEKAHPEEKKSCRSCHEEQARFQAYGSHASASCADCHRIEGNHEETGEEPFLGGDSMCLECHDLVEDADSKKLSEEEILEKHIRYVEKKHVIKVDRKKAKKRCVECHDPHLGQ
jgi:hypothetical protein